MDENCFARSEIPTGTVIVETGVLRFRCLRCEERQILKVTSDREGGTTTGGASSWGPTMMALPSGSIWSRASLGSSIA